MEETVFGIIFLINALFLEFVGMMVAEDLELRPQMLCLNRNL